MIKQIALKDVRIDGGTQQRPTKKDAVQAYKSDMERKEVFPPVEVMYDGEAYWLWDGFHRYHAHRKKGDNYIEAHITEGTQRQAIFASFGANTKHGIRRETEDLKNIIRKILADDEWKYATHEEIGIHLSFSRRYVTSLVKQIEDEDKKKAAAKKKAEEAARKKVEGDGSGPKMAKKAISGKEESSTEEPPEPVLDTTGREVPSHLAPVFSRVDEVKEHVKVINKILKTVREAQAANDPLYRNCKLESLKMDIGNVKRNLRFTLPHAVCRYCGGDVNNATCRACGGAGFLNEISFIAVPEDMK